MADASSSIFNKRATEKLRSPDDLDKYVRVTNPGIWALLGACMALLIGLFSWGFFGSVTTSVSTTGVVHKGQAMCFLSAEDVAKVNEGDVANFAGHTMKVVDVAAIPNSSEEVSEMLDSDYLASVLVQGEWAYRVVFRGEAEDFDQGVPLAVSITTERIAPISLILGGSE